MQQPTFPKEPLSKDLLQVFISHHFDEDESQITFAEFMETALYHPEFGYYASTAQQIGPKGDFVTSPHMGADFGELIGEQLREFWRHLGQPIPYDLVEMGAGQGLLAKDILGYLRREDSECFAAVHYRIIETATALRSFQQKFLQPQFPELLEGDRLTWCDLDDISKGSITGCFFSNELVDAFPVHRVTVKDGKLLENYVALRPGMDAKNPDPEDPFVDLWDKPSTPAIAQYFQNLDIDLTQPPYPDGYVTEVNLAAPKWLEKVAIALNHGYILTVDYGYTAQRYYQPARSGGTLQCYTRHAHHDNPYSNLGHQDITAHVDFTTLEKTGESLGLTNLGFTLPALFLMSLGLGDRLSALATDEYPTGNQLQTLLRRRDSLQRLIDPLGLGNFGVLVQCKSAADSAVLETLPLRGLTVPEWGS
ncbi:MAG: SAM-dependent methyltransferase [Cyanobacteria bacterium P01_D01_bin.73]